MKRKMMLTTTAATLIALPGLLAAASPEASTGTGTEVGSTSTSTYNTNSPAVSNGFAEMDPVTIGMDRELFDALIASPGTNILSTEGDAVGTIETVMVNALGNPELVVDLTNQSEIPAEVLVVTVKPGSVMARDGLLYLDTSIDELQLKARNNSGRDSDDRVQITLF